MSSGFTSLHRPSDRHPQPMQPVRLSRSRCSRVIWPSRSSRQASDRRSQSPRVGVRPPGSWSSAALIPAQRDPDALRGPDEGDAAEHFARVPALVPRGPPTGDQALRLVEVQGGNRDAAALSDLADGEFAVSGWCGWLLRHGLDLGRGLDLGHWLDLNDT